MPLLQSIGTTSFGGAGACECRHYNQSEQQVLVVTNKQDKKLLWRWRVQVPLSDMTGIDDDDDQYNTPEYGGVDGIAD